MPFFFLEVEYLGTHYYGFQLQNKPGKNEISVQGTLEKALCKLFYTPIRIDYVSRTDRGVHARAQGVGFSVDTRIPLVNIKKALNSYLPDDIRIVRVKKFDQPFLLSTAVLTKTYRYTIFNRRQASVFVKDFSWHVNQPLDLAAIRKIIPLVKGKRDFSLFAKQAKSYRSCVRWVKQITVKRRGEFVDIDITADGFLRNMVRMIVHFLVDIGRGRIDASQAKKILKKERPYLNKPAPAQGLCLMRINYEKKQHL